MYKLTSLSSLSAAHYLRDYKGTCQRIHGHNWKIEITIESDRMNGLGMVMDFKEIKELTWQAVGRFDHQVFNDIAPFDKLNPTAENISKHFYQEIAKLLPEGIKLSNVKLWETEKYCIEYSE